MSPARAFHGFVPEIPALAYIDPSAQVIGQVSMGEGSSIWPCAVVRADMHPVRIGERTNIQDGALLHVTHDTRYTLGGFGLSIGDDVSIGHGAALHGCAIQSACFIGMRAVVLGGTLVKRHSMIGAGAVVTQGKVVGEGELWVGNPARCVRMLTLDEIRNIYYVANHYASLQARYREVRRPAHAAASMSERDFA